MWADLTGSELTSTHFIHMATAAWKSYQHRYFRSHCGMTVQYAQQSSSIKRFSNLIILCSFLRLYSIKKITDFYRSNQNATYWGAYRFHIAVQWLYTVYHPHRIPTELWHITCETKQFIIKIVSSISESRVTSAVGEHRGNDHHMPSTTAYYDDHLSYCTYAKIGKIWISSANANLQKIWRKWQLHNSQKYTIYMTQINYFHSSVNTA